MIRDEIASALLEVARALEGVARALASAEPIKEAEPAAQSVAPGAFDFKPPLPTKFELIVPDPAPLPRGTSALYQMAERVKTESGKSIKFVPGLVVPLPKLRQAEVRDYIAKHRLDHDSPMDIAFAVGVLLRAKPYGPQPEAEEGEYE